MKLSTLRIYHFSLMFSFMNLSAFSVDYLLGRDGHLGTVQLHLQPGLRPLDGRDVPPAELDPEQVHSVEDRAGLCHQHIRLGLHARQRHQLGSWSGCPQQRPLSLHHLPGMATLVSFNLNFLQKYLNTFSNLRPASPT